MKRFLVALFVVALLVVGIAVAVADDGIVQSGTFGVLDARSQQLQNVELVASVTDTAVAAEQVDVSNPIDVQAMGIQVEVQRPQHPSSRLNTQTKATQRALSSWSFSEDSVFSPDRERNRWAVSI